MRKAWLVVAVAIAAFVIVPVWMAYAADPAAPADQGAGGAARGMRQPQITLTPEQTAALVKPTADLKTAITTFQTAATTTLGDEAKGKVYTAQVLRAAANELNPPPARAPRGGGGGGGGGGK